MAILWKNLASLFVFLFVSCGAASADPTPKGKTKVIGNIKFAIYDTATSQTLLSGEKTVETKDVEIKSLPKLFNKRIKLGEHFYFGLADSADYDKPDGGLVTTKSKDGRKLDNDGYVLGDKPESKKPYLGGFGLTGSRDDVRTFAWDWFNVDRAGHATKLQESGELQFDIKKSPNGTEIHHMEFLTDVSIRVTRMNDNPDPLHPAWRIKILRGSTMTWPVLVDGEVRTLPE